MTTTSKWANYDVARSRLLIQMGLGVQPLIGRT